MNQTKEQIEEEYNKIQEPAYAKYEKIRDLAFAEKQRKLEELVDETK